MLFAEAQGFNYSCNAAVQLIYVTDMIHIGAGTYIDEREPYNSANIASSIVWKHLRDVERHRANND